jgi:PAS domain S-box-containing protein
VTSGQPQCELRSEKSLLEAALQNMPHGLCMYEKDGRIILFNDRYAKLMGIPPTDLKGLYLLDIFKLRKAAGHLSGDPEEELRAVISDVQEGRPGTRIIEA